MAVESWITPEETPALAEAATAMGMLSAKSDYECLRDARISENMVRRKHLLQMARSDLHRTRNFLRRH